MVLESIPSYTKIEWKIPVVAQEIENTKKKQANESGVALVGRQTIYDRNLDVLGYELLYRPIEGVNSAEEKSFDPSEATGEVVINAFMEMGLEKLVDDKLAFINLSQEYVEGLLPIVFPCETVVLEILEDIDPTPVVIAGIERLKERGYTLALDDFVFDEHLMPLVPLVDIIKVDIMGLTDDELETGMSKIEEIFTGKLLAEKVETQDEFDMCKQMGFDYFQGYFLEKPVVIKGAKMPSNKVAIIQILSRLQEGWIEYEELEDIVKQDPSLSFKILRYINSPAFNLDSEVSSIKQALVLLGLDTLKQWMTLIVISNASDRSPDLISKALCRARMCELLAKLLKLENQNQFFLVGLFSILDAMLGLDRSEVLNQIPLQKELKVALLEGKGKMGAILKCAVAYEHADWDNVKCGKVPLAVIKKVYLKSLDWTNAQLHGIQ